MHYNKLLIILGLCCAIGSTVVADDSNIIKDSQELVQRVSKSKSDDSFSKYLKKLENLISDAVEAQSEYDELIKKSTVVSEQLASVQNQIDKLDSTKKVLVADIDKLRADVDTLTKQKAEKEAEASWVSSEASKSKEKEAESVRTMTSSGSTTNTAPRDSASVGAATYGPGQEKEAFAQITKELNLSDSDKAIWEDIITKESGWNTTIANPSSGAYGIGQALPASKMAPYGDDYLTNPYTQLKWMYDYIMERYKSFDGLANFWAENSWY